MVRLLLGEGRSLIRRLGHSDRRAGSRLIRRRARAPLARSSRDRPDSWTRARPGHPGLKVGHIRRQRSATEATTRPETAAIGQLSGPTKRRGRTRTHEGPNGPQRFSRSLRDGLRDFAYWSETERARIAGSRDRCPDARLPLPREAVAQMGWLSGRRSGGPWAARLPGCVAGRLGVLSGGRERDLAPVELEEVVGGGD